jgi:hypothetical protein
MSAADQIPRGLDELFSSVSGLNEALRTVSQISRGFMDSSRAADRKAHDDARRIRMLDEKIQKFYATSTDQVNALLEKLNSAMTDRVSGASGDKQIPDVRDVPKIMHSFFFRQLKTRTSPQPNHCGCYAYKRAAHAGDFICARDHGLFCLMIIISCEVEGNCTAFHPTDLENGIQAVEISKEDFTLLPIVLPDRPLRRWEHARDTIVLSLWNENEESDVEAEARWTTEFFKARVVEQPCDNESESRPRGYILDFGEERPNHRLVPEKFVVQKREGW